jgi:hypothetical protein
MFRVGSYYITAQGRLAKVVSEFKYIDGGIFTVAIQYPGSGWIADRIKVDGKSVTNTNHNILETDDFKGFLTFCKSVIDYDRGAKTWKGQIYDLTGASLLSLTGIESQERTLKLLQLGAQEKILTWMQETGYIDEEMDEGAE